MSWANRCLRWIGTHPTEIVLPVIITAFFAWLQVPSLLVTILFIAVAVSLLVVFSIQYAKKLSDAYYVILLTWDEHDKDSVLTAAKRFFSRQHIPQSAAKELVKVGSVGHDDWNELLNRALERLNELQEKHHELHLVCNAYWLWCFALGTQIQDRYPLVLYHFQDGTYYRIWQMSRDIKNRKALRTNRYDYQVCHPPELIREGQRADAVGLVFACGSHDPCPAVKKFVEMELQNVPLWAIHLEGGLAPSNPTRWVNAAADLANAVDHLSESGNKKLYVFGTMPDTLALMTGSAVGPYRHINLMQYHKGSYYEVMVLNPKP